MSESVRDFFAIGKPQWTQVCSMGLNHAVCYLVLARGTGRDNSTTRWSAEAVFKHTGMAWRRATTAIAEMDKTSLVKSSTLKGKRPTRKLVVPADMKDMLWLPNELVTGAAKEVPPVNRLRQMQNVEYLQTFIELYGVHDLAGDGGLPRSLMWKPYDVREHICDQGQFMVYGFGSTKDIRYCNTHSVLVRFHARKDKSSDAWSFISAMERMGLLETVDYLVESDSPDSELIHALTGDDLAVEVRYAAAAAADGMPGGYKYEVDRFDYVLPVLKHMQNAAVVGVTRLVYRPKTMRTAAWYANHQNSCRQFANRYSAIASGDFQQAMCA